MAISNLFWLLNSLPNQKSIEVTNGDSTSVIVELYEGKRTVKETVIEAEPVEDSETKTQKKKNQKSKEKLSTNVVTN